MALLPFCYPNSHFINCNLFISNHLFGFSENLHYPFTTQSLPFYYPFTTPGLPLRRSSTDIRLPIYYPRG